LGFGKRSFLFRDKFWMTFPRTNFTFIPFYAPGGFPTQPIYYRLGNQVTSTLSESKLQIAPATTAQLIIKVDPVLSN